MKVHFLKRKNFFFHFRIRHIKSSSCNLQAPSENMSAFTRTHLHKRVEEAEGTDIDSFFEKSLPFRRFLIHQFINSFSDPSQRSHKENNDFTSDMEILEMFGKHIPPSKKTVALFPNSDCRNEKEKEKEKGKPSDKPNANPSSVPLTISPNPPYLPIPLSMPKGIPKPQISIWHILL